MFECLITLTFHMTNLNKGIQFILCIVIKIVVFNEK